MTSPSVLSADALRSVQIGAGGCASAAANSACTAGGTYASIVAVRSVAEMLARPFDALTIDDLPEILEHAGEARETLFFERKAEITPESLAKSCAAFANTMGGLVVVGVRDDDDTPIGIERQAPEAQVWVKDMLRGRLLPLPPFRARWLPLGDDVPDRAVLLVMVAESTTTPHILTRRGAIYVRNPGSSDPVPIADQRRLYSLIERGERSQQHAKSEALKSVSEAPIDPVRTWQLFAVVPTGVADDHRARLFTPGGASRVLKVFCTTCTEKAGAGRRRGRTGRFTSRRRSITSDGQTEITDVVSNLSRRRTTARSPSGTASRRMTRRASSWRQSSRTSSASCARRASSYSILAGTATSCSRGASFFQRQPESTFSTR